MKNCILFLLSAVLLASCGTSMEVFSDSDKALNISNYHTYNWPQLKAIESKGMNPLYYNELNDKRIRDAVNKEMAARNFSMSTGSAELEIHYHIIVEDKMGTYTETGGNQNHPMAYTPRITNYQYRQGTLIIDVMDIKTNSLVWRGWATDVVTNTARKNPEAAIQNAVSKIFKVFPKVTQ